MPIRSLKKLLYSKKSMDIDLWFNAFELLVVLIVGIVLVDFVNGEIKNTAFEKQYFSRDNALLINTIYSAPGNVEYKYPYKSDNTFIFDFKQGTIEVYAPDESVEGGAVTYPFAQDLNYQLKEAKIKATPSTSPTYLKNTKKIEITQIQ